METVRLDGALLTERAQAMARAGRALVETMFDRQRNIAALRDLYETAVRSRPVAGK